MLCKKWGVKELYMGNSKINSEGETLTYEFYPDQTMKRITEKKTEKGKWEFLAEKKLVHLVVTKKIDLYIPVLRETMFELVTEDPTSDKKEEMQGFAIRIVMEPRD